MQTPVPYLPQTPPEFTAYERRPPLTRRSPGCRTAGFQGFRVSDQAETQQAAGFDT